MVAHSDGFILSGLGQEDCHEFKAVPGYRCLNPHLSHPQKTKKSCERADTGQCCLGSPLSGFSGVESYCSTAGRSQLCFPRSNGTTLLRDAFQG